MEKQQLIERTIEYKTASGNQAYNPFDNNWIKKLKDKYKTASGNQAYNHFSKGRVTVRETLVQNRKR